MFKDAQRQAAPCFSTPSCGNGGLDANLRLHPRSFEAGMLTLLVGLLQGQVSTCIAAQEMLAVRHQIAVLNGRMDASGCEGWDRVHSLQPASMEDITGWRSNTTGASFAPSICAASGPTLSQSLGQVGNREEQADTFRALQAVANPSVGGERRGRQLWGSCPHSVHRKASEGCFTLKQRIHCVEEELGQYRLLKAGLLACACACVCMQADGLVGQCYAQACQQGLKAVDPVESSGSHSHT